MGLASFQRKRDRAMIPLACAISPDVLIGLLDVHDLYSARS